MDFSDISSHNFTVSQKQAVFKIAVELVKADKRIHSQEISVLSRLQEILALKQEQLDLIHYFTMQEAIAVLKNCEDGTAEVLCDLFSRIMCSDSDIDFDESILLSSVTMSISAASKKWCSVISIPFSDSQASERQIIFLEKKHSRAAHEILDDAYDNLLISKAFGDIGLRLLYLPDILKKLGARSGTFTGTADRKYNLLKRSMEFIVPAGNKIKLNNLDTALKSLDSATFLRVILSRYGLSSDAVPFDSFLLLKISDSQILNDSDALEGSVNFLCIDLSDDVKKRIFDFISQFDEQNSLISYEGYYKFIYDYLSSESKSVNPIKLDSSYQFYVGDTFAQLITFESSPQARTLYLLLLFYGHCGISQSVFNDAINILKTQMINDERFDYLMFKSHLMQDGSEPARLIANTMEIYRSISTKDEENADFIKYVTSILKHRSSLKNYINKGFSECSSLANPERFVVSYDNNSKSYILNASTSDFRMDTGDGVTTIQESSLWKSLR